MTDYDRDPEPNHAPFGNLDRQAQAGDASSGVATTNCDHHYEVRILGGHPISVRACTLCRTPDWRDLYEQAESLFRWGRKEGLAGKPPREHLSAYDMPRDPQERHAPTEATEPEHVCKPGATTYFCPARGEMESDCHGGFDQCCDRPDLHRPTAETGPCPACRRADQAGLAPSELHPECVEEAA